MRCVGVASVVSQPQVGYPRLAQESVGASERVMEYLDRQPAAQLNSGATLPSFSGRVLGSLGHHVMGTAQLVVDRDPHACAHDVCIILGAALWRVTTS